MDPKLQAAIEKSTLLPDELRQRLQKEGAQLTPDQVTRIIKLIEGAEANKTKMEADLENRKQALTQKYLEEMKRIAKEAPKKVMKAAEMAGHKAEEEGMEDLLEKLDNV